MAKLARKRILGNKYLTKILRRIAHQQGPAIALLVAMSAMPVEAMAFEGNLPVTSPQLVAVVKLVEKTGETVQFGQQVPAYSYRLSGTVTAHPSPETQAGNWPKKRTKLALSTPKAKAKTGPVVLEGEASYYSRAGCLGCSPSLTMANGQPLNDSALTMAIGAHLKHLVGRQATVTSLATGKEVQVLITDTGGFYQSKYGNRVADLTVATKQAIGMAGGVGQVRVTVH